MCAQPLSARVLVIGDSGVGKSSLIHLLCHNEVLTAPQTTIGCRISVKVRQRPCPGKLQFVEFLEVGGNPKYRREARFPFYHSYHAIIFVHDLADESTLASLWEWHKEVRDCTGRRGATAEGPVTALPSCAPHPHSRVAENPYASISQRRPGAPGSRPTSTTPKGYWHRPTSQTFDASDSQRQLYEAGPQSATVTPATSSTDYYLEDDALQTAHHLTHPLVLIVGTKADLCSVTPAGVAYPVGSWQQDAMHLGSLLLRQAAHVMQRVLFLPRPMRSFLRIDGPAPNGDSGRPAPLAGKASDLLAYLREEWNAPALALSCHVPQEAPLHKVDLFLDKVMDSVYSSTCRV